MFAACSRPPTIATALASAGLLITLTSCKPQSPVEVQALPEPSGPAGITEIIGWTPASSSVLAEDLNGDHRPDLVLTSHSDNRVQAFVQRSDHGFDPLPALDGVGFHPNGVTLLPNSSGLPFLAQNAETLNELRIYQYRAGAMVYIGSVPAQIPLETLAFDWHCWPRSLVVFPLAGSDFEVYRNLEPAGPSFAEHFQHSGAIGRGGRRLLSPLAADIDGDGQDEILFLDSGSGAIRVLRADQGGNLFLDRLVIPLPATLRATALYARDMNSDGRADLFVVGQPTSPLYLLLSDGNGAYSRTEIPLPPDFHQEGIFVQDADGSPLLILGRQRSVVALRFNAGATAPPQQLVLDKGAGIGWLSMATADFDGDGAPDVVMAPSGIRTMPPLVVHGPLWQRMRELLAYISNPDRFPPRPLSTETP
ncbi:MAG: VCBS repeat-containing protein [Planctomycetes bacterium]|nr:VCBS repeat-containing protein [Planctomycetota bacterium]